MMPETCWDGSLVINIGLVTSCWSISLHPICEAVKLPQLLTRIAIRQQKAWKVQKTQL